MENFVEKVDNSKKLVLDTRNATLDDKGRINIPSVFRDTLDEGFIISKHTDKELNCLLIFTESEWNRIYEKFKAKPNKQFTKAMRFLEASKIIPKQGRFVVPARLREYADLEDDLIVIGMGDTAEVWSKQEKERYENEDNDVGEILDDV